MARKTGIKSASAAAALSYVISAILAQAQAQTPPTDESEDDRTIANVVVTGVRGSIVEGLENKREAVQVVESIVAEDIGKLPDNNVVEALQRISGVQITDRGGGEADAILIRGLPDVTTTWNGRNVFTAPTTLPNQPAGAGRQLALQDIPANLVGRVDVFKTRAADQLEAGLAGQIDVRTRRPFDLPGMELSLNARATTQEQRDDIDPTASLLFSNRWDTAQGDFGALFNVNYSRTRFRDQSVTAGAMVPFSSATNPPVGLGAALDNCPDTPPDNPNWVPLERIFNTDCRATPLGQVPPLLWQGGLDAGLPTAPGSTLNINGTDYEYLLARDALFASDFEGDRERPAATIALQWAPNDTSEYTFEAFYQGYREEMFNNLHFTFADWWGSLGPNPASTLELYPGTNIIKSRTVGAPFGFNSGDATEQQTDTFVYAINGAWQIGDKLSLSADLSLQDSEFETSFIAVRTVRVPTSLTADFNAGNGIPSWHFNDDAEMLDPTRWTVGELYQNEGRTEGTARTLSIDADYEIDTGIFKMLSFGVRYDDRDALLYSPAPEPIPFLGRPLSDFPEALWTNRNFMDGEADVPRSWAVVNGYWLNNHRGEVRELFGEPVGGLELIRAFEVQEETTSAYVQADMEIGKLQAQVGVRYVSVDTPMEFTDVIDGDTATSKQSVSDLLPSLTLRYSVTDDIRLRFNYGETLRRPRFSDLNANFSLVDDLTNVGYGSGTGGNPDLEPTQSKNYDLTAEWYFANDSAVYATLFRRDIEGLVVPLTRLVTVPGTGFVADQFMITQPVNASDGELEGFELGLVYFPALPGLLNGLGVQASFTKLDSSQNIPLSNSEGEIIGEENSEFFGVSDTSYNITLAYDRSGLGMRLSYVWRDDFLNNNEARNFANPIGIWRQAESSLDFQASYNFNDSLAVSFDAVNITEELQQSYYAFGAAGGERTHNFGTTLISRAFALGLRWRF